MLVVGGAGLVHGGGGGGLTIGGSGAFGAFASATARPGLVFPVPVCCPPGFAGAGFAVCASAEAGVSPESAHATSVADVEANVVEEIGAIAPEVAAHRAAPPKLLTFRSSRTS